MDVKHILARTGLVGDKPPMAHNDTFVRSWIKKMVFSGMPCHEAQDLGNTISALRQGSGRCSRPVNMYVAIWGFGNLQQRNTVLRGLRYGLRPRVMYVTQERASSGRSNYFEGLLCLQEQVISVEDLEALLARCRMSIGTADLDSMMSDAMLTCISRISAGECEFGNWRTAQNTCYRMEFTRQMAARTDRESRQHLLHVTGLALNTSNMLSLFHGEQNLRIEMRLTNQHLQEIVMLIEANSAETEEVMRTAINQNGADGDGLRLGLSSHLNNMEGIGMRVMELANRAYSLGDRRLGQVYPPPPPVQFVRVPPPSDLMPIDLTAD